MDDSSPVGSKVNVVETSLHGTNLHELASGVLTKLSRQYQCCRRPSILDGAEAQYLQDQIRDTYR